MSSHNLRIQIESKAKSTSGVNNINSGELESLEIPLFPIQEQHQIVKEIESRLSVCDKVEQSITESLEKAKALRQSILKKAFQGTLLSAAEIAKCKQEQDYEPASVLLAKIKVEKKKSS
ncbi:Type-1 restriction enzyme EcoKI specificity protein [compost metagenome]